MELPDLLVNGYSIHLDHITCELNQYDDDVIFGNAAVGILDSFQQFCDTGLRPASERLSNQLPHEVLTDLIALYDSMYSTHSRFVSKTTPFSRQERPIPTCASITVESDLTVAEIGMMETMADLERQLMWAVGNWIGVRCDVGMKHIRSRTYFFGGLKVDVDVAALVSAVLLQSIHRYVAREMASRTDLFDILAQIGPIASQLVCVLQDKIYLEGVSYRRQDFQDSTQIHQVYSGSKAHRQELGAKAIERNRSKLRPKPHKEPESQAFEPPTNSSTSQPPVPTSSTFVPHATSDRTSLHPTAPAQPSSSSSTNPLDSSSAIPSSSRDQQPAEAPAIPIRVNLPPPARSGDSKQWPADYSSILVQQFGPSGFLASDRKENGEIDPLAKKKKPCLTLDMFNGEEAYLQQMRERFVVGGSNVLYPSTENLNDESNPSAPIYFPFCEGATAKEMAEAQTIRIEQDSSNPDGGTYISALRMIFKRCDAVMISFYLLSAFFMLFLGSDQMVEDFFSKPNARLHLILPELFIEDYSDKFRVCHTLLLAKLQAKNYYLRGDFLTCEFVKQVYPAALHSKVLLAADELTETLITSDGSGNLSMYGMGAQLSMNNNNGEPRTNPKLSSESILISTIPTESDYGKTTINQFDRRWASVVLAGRVVDVLISLFKNRRGSPEKIADDNDRFKASFKLTPDKEEDESRKLAVVKPHFAQKILEKLPLHIRNIFSVVTPMSPQPTYFPPEYRPSQDRFKAAYSFPTNARLLIYCFSCDQIMGEQGVKFKLKKGLDPLSGCILNHPGPKTATTRPIQCGKATSVGIRCHAVQIGTRKGKVDPALLAEGRKELKKFKEHKGKILRFFEFGDLFASGTEVVGDKMLLLWYLDISKKGEVKEIKGYKEVAESVLDWIEQARQKVKRDSLVWDLAVCRVLNNSSAFGRQLDATFGSVVWIKDNPNISGPQPRTMHFDMIPQIVEHNRARLNKYWIKASHIRGDHEQAAFHARGNPYEKSSGVDLVIEGDISDAEESDEEGIDSEEEDEDSEADSEMEEAAEQSRENALENLREGVKVKKVTKQKQKSKKSKPKQSKRKT